MNKKITGYNSSQTSVEEKKKFKADSYLTEINQRESDLGKVKEQLADQEEEMKNLSITREKFRLERDYLHSELTTMETAFKDLKQKYDD